MHKLFLFVLALLFASSAMLLLIEIEMPFPAKEINRTSFVQRTIDGDTIILANGERVRLLGIDAPEKGQRCFEESKQFLHQIVSGRLAELSFDAEQTDKYGRTLAYISIDGNFINLKMVENGFAVAFPFEPNLLHADEFAVAEQYAREQQIGCLWQQG